MTRSVLPKKLDSKFHRNMAMELDDGFGTFMTCLVVLVGSSIAAGYLAFYSLLFLFLLVPALLVCRTGISLFKNSIPRAAYLSENDLYNQAYTSLRAINEPNSFEDAKILATNIWQHEKAITDRDKRHKTQRDCPDCYKRVQLIVDLHENQPLPYVDGSDIERIEAKLAARKELRA